MTIPSLTSERYAYKVLALVLTSEPYLSHLFDEGRCSGFRTENHIRIDLKERWIYAISFEYFQEWKITYGINIPDAISVLVFDNIVWFRYKRHHLEQEFCELRFHINTLHDAVDDGVVGPFPEYADKLKRAEPLASVGPSAPSTLPPATPYKPTSTRSSFIKGALAALMIEPVLLWGLEWSTRPWMEEATVMLFGSIVLAATVFLNRPKKPLDPPETNLVCSAVYRCIDQIHQHVPRIGVGAEIRKQIEVLTTLAQTLEQRIELPEWASVEFERSLQHVDQLVALCASKWGHNEAYQPPLVEAEQAILAAGALWQHVLITSQQPVDTKISEHANSLQRLCTRLLPPESLGTQTLQ